jgi:hypothetical protein
MKEAVEFVPACVSRPLSQKRTKANFDAAQARRIVSSAPIRKQGWSQPYVVPLRVRQDVQERRDPDGCDECSSTPRAILLGLSALPRNGVRAIRQCAPCVVGKSG